MADNKFDEIISRVSAHLDELKNLNAEQVLLVLLELKSEKQIWNSLPKGNREYFEKALESQTEPALLGAIPHLTKALPHRFGFIASKLKEKISIGDPTFDDVIAGKRSIAELDHKQIAQFIRDFRESTKVKDFLHPKIFDNNMRTLGFILKKYDRLHGENVELAKEYLEVEKKQSVFNLFTKVLLPQLMGGIARSKK